MRLWSPSSILCESGLHWSSSTNNNNNNVLSFRLYGRWGRKEIIILNERCTANNFPGLISSSSLLKAKITRHRCSFCAFPMDGGTMYTHTSYVVCLVMDGLKGNLHMTLLRVPNTWVRLRVGLFIWGELQQHIKSVIGPDEDLEHFSVFGQEERCRGEAGEMGFIRKLNVSALLHF